MQKYEFYLEIEEIEIFLIDLMEQEIEEQYVVF